MFTAAPDCGCLASSWSRSPRTKLRPEMCSAAALRQAALPRQRMGDDGRQVVELRLPSQRGTDAVARGDDLCGIAGPAARELDLEVGAGDPFHGLDDVQHGK